MKQINELTTDELKRVLELRQCIDEILHSDKEEMLDRAINESNERFESYTPEQRKELGEHARSIMHPKKLHWTQTPAGKRKMKAAQEKAWRDRRARAAANNPPATTP